MKTTNTIHQLALNLPHPQAARQALFLSTDGQPFTTSRAVAERFGKQHKDVLKAIRTLLDDMPDPEFGRRNFAPSSYLNAQRKTQPEYRLTHDGFALLAMGLTGTDALAWKVAFLQAFRTLEAELAERTARFARALHTLRPALLPVVQGTEQGQTRADIAAPLGKSLAAISYHRGRARRLGLLPLHRRGRA